MVHPLRPDQTPPDSFIARSIIRCTAASFLPSSATAAQQQRYLGTFIPPRKPETAIYPTRMINIAVFVILTLILWAIGVLAVYAVRDHTT